MRHILMNDTLTPLDRFDLRPRAKGKLRALFGTAPRASRPAANPARDF